MVLLRGWVQTPLAVWDQSRCWKTQWFVERRIKGGKSRQRPRCCWLSADRADRSADHKARSLWQVSESGSVYLKCNLKTWNDWTNWCCSTIIEIKQKKEKKQKVKNPEQKSTLQRSKTFVNLLFKGGRKRDASRGRSKSPSRDKTGKGSWVFV